MSGRRFWIGHGLGAGAVGALGFGVGCLFQARPQVAFAVSVGLLLVAAGAALVAVARAAADCYHFSTAQLPADGPKADYGELPPLSPPGP